METVAAEGIHMALNPAERIEVVRRIGHRMSAKAISERLGISERGVERYRAQLEQANA